MLTLKYDRVFLPNVVSVHLSVREVISLVDLSSGSYCTLSRPITSFYDFRSFIFSRPLDGLRFLYDSIGVCAAVFG